ncbi:nitroreductase family protein [Actinoplanes sp. NPDC026670]|uniref:nitroreductase family protein n=1 Tax=Actinoplanes sp. NPDC026670 TaxID=3154700 RepID=UPI003410347C
MTNRTAVLAHAARLARHAPSILNTQPWQWRIGRHTAELRTDPTRALPLVDPQQHLTHLSCGAALHHATVAIHALGWDVDIERGTAPLARLVLTRPATQRDTDLAAAITRRHTDRRPFSAQTPSDKTIAVLRHAAENQGLHTHLVRRDEIPLLAATTARAASDATHRPGHTPEIAHWTDGADSTAGHRAVPLRDGDIGARYLVLHGPGDTPTDWLRAGEALSALLLTATVHGLACSPMSEPVEAPWPRGLLATLIGEPSHPYLVIRCGYPTHDEPPPATPRRPEAETTTYLMGASTRP